MEKDNQNGRHRRSSSSSSSESDDNHVTQLGKNEKSRSTTEQVSCEDVLSSRIDSDNDNQSKIDNVQSYWQRNYSFEKDPIPTKVEDCLGNMEPSCDVLIFGQKLGITDMESGGPQLDKGRMQAGGGDRELAFIMKQNINPRLNIETIVESDVTTDFGTLNSNYTTVCTNTSTAHTSTSNRILNQQKVEEGTSKAHASTSKDTMRDGILGQQEIEEIPVDGYSTINEDMANTSSKEKTEHMDRGEWQALRERDEVAEHGSTTVDIVRAIKEQTTHDLICPSCGSCITKRVILRKRKRTSAPKTGELKVQKTQDDEKSDHNELPKVIHGQIAEENEDVEAFGCLACFTLFVRQVRNVGRNYISEHHYSLISTQQQQGVSHERVPCLPLLLPAFTWSAGKNEEIKQVVKTKKEVDISSCPEEIHEQSRLNCIPALLPEYTWSAREEEGNVSEEISLADERRLNCLPILLPKYHWTKKSAQQVETTEEACTSATQEEIVDEPKLLADSDKSAHIAELVEKSKLNCLPIWFPEYRWKLSELSKAKEVQTVPRPEPEVHQQFEKKGIQISPEIRQTDKGSSSSLPILVSKYPCEGTGLSSLEVAETTEEQASEEREQILEKSMLNCIPILLPDYLWEGTTELSKREDVEDNGQIEKASFNCLLISLPKYTWGYSPQVTGAEKSAQISKHQEEESKKSKISCIPILLPKYMWGIYEKEEVQVSSEICQTSEGSFDSPSPQEVQISSETCQTSEASFDLPSPEEAQASEQKEELIEKSNLNCIPIVVPEYLWRTERSGRGGSLRPSTEVQISTQTENVNRLPISWGVSEIISPQGPQVEPGETSKLNCIPMLLPNYVWEGSKLSTEGAHRSTEAIRSQSEEGSFSCLPIIKYPWWNTKESSLQEAGALEDNQNADGQPILLPLVDTGLCQQEDTKKTSANNNSTYIEVKPDDETFSTQITMTESKVEVNEIGALGTLKVDESTLTTNNTGNMGTAIGTMKDDNFIMTAITSTNLGTVIETADDDKPVPYADFTIDTKSKFDNQKPLTDERTGDTPRKTTTGSIQEHAAQDEKTGTTSREAPTQNIQEHAVQSLSQKTINLDRGAICSCLPYTLPSLRWKWPTARHSATGLMEPLITQDGTEREVVSTSVAVSQESLVQVISGTTTTITSGLSQPVHQLAPIDAIQDQDTIIHVVDTATTTSTTTTTTTTTVATSDLFDQHAPSAPGQEYLKSLVYGGLDVSLTSLGVVASAAGAEAKTITVLAMGLANLLTGLLVLLHNITVMYYTDEVAYKANVGQTFRLHGSLTIISYLIFGCISPLTYALSFRYSDDRDYKFSVTAAMALICLVLLGLGKARVRRLSYATTIIALITVGFAASIAGFFAGDFLKTWLQKIGFDTPPDGGNKGSLPLFPS